MIANLDKKPVVEGNNYKAGKFCWTVDGRDVLLTKDTASGIITVNLFEYESEERAHDAAWRMASLQARA